MSKSIIHDTNEKKLLSPKRDIVFQVLFGEVGNENITKSFLEAILNENITEVDLSKNPILRHLKPTSKMGILDVIALINQKEYCNIEMQVGKREDIIQRILYYWARTYERSLHIKENYSLLKRTIVILIADFEIPGLEELGYFIDWKLIETNSRKVILTDYMEVVIIELPKVYKLKINEKNNKLLDWIYFLEDPNSEKVKKIMKNNENIKEAKEKLEEISNDEIMQRLADWREAAEHDEASVKAMSFNEGLKEGMEKGMKRGIEKRNLEIAKEMKEKGIDINTISQITGLTIEEISKL